MGPGDGGWVGASGPGAARLSPDPIMRAWGLLVSHAPAAVSAKILSHLGRWDRNFSHPTFLEVLVGHCRWDRNL